MASTLLNSLVACSALLFSSWSFSAEILIANPDATKKEGFLKWAELEANYPIPGYVVDAVEASWDAKTYRTTLEESIADKHTRLTQLAAHAIYLLQTDTLPPPPDSLRWVWQQVRTNRARYSEAALLLGLGDHAGAQAIVEAMPAEREPKAPEEQERQRMLTYISVLRTANPGEPYWTVQGMLMDLDLQELGPTAIDATGIAALQAIALDEKEGCGQARAWLLLLGESFNEPIVLPTTEKRAHARTQAEDGFVWHPLLVFPNPSKGPVSIVYEVPDVVEDAQIRVMDALGRLTHQQRVGGKGIVELDLPRSTPGLHIIGLYYDGQLIGTEKLGLVR